MTGTFTADPLVLDAHGRHAQCVVFTADGKRLLSTGQDAAIRIWSVPKFSPSGAITGHANSVNTLAFAPGGKRFATSSTDGTVRVWSFPKGENLHTFEKQTGGVFTPDGAHLLTVSPKGRLTLWETKRYAEAAALPAPDSRVTAVTLTLDGQVALVGGTGPIHRLRLPDGEPLGPLTGHKTVVMSLRGSPDGSLLASTGYDGSLRLWSTADWKTVRTIPLKSAGIFQVAWSPSGDTLAVSVDNGILLFDPATGALRQRLAVPVKGAYGLAFSPDGRFLANAAADGRLRIWSL
jgi:WD40 repeat protein